MNGMKWQFIHYRHRLKLSFIGLYPIISPLYFAATKKHPGLRGILCVRTTGHGAGSEHQRSGRRVQCQARAVACHGAKTPWTAARG